MTLSVRWQVSSAGSADSPNRRYPSVSSSGRTFSEDKLRASWLKATSHVLWKKRSNSQRGRRQIICPAGVVRSQRSDAKADASCSGARALSSPMLVAVEIEHGWPRRIIPGGPWREAARPPVLVPGFPVRTPRARGPWRLWTRPCPVVRGAFPAVALLSPHP